VGRTDDDDVECRFAIAVAVSGCLCGLAAAVAACRPPSLETEGHLQGSSLLDIVRVHAPGVEASRAKLGQRAVRGRRKGLEASGR
jgi:hypothetical protein